MATSSNPPDSPELKGDGETINNDSTNPGEALAKFDFSLLDPGSHAHPGSQDLDHSDAHAALASMSSADALDYAISQMGFIDHVDAGHSDTGHFDAPGDTSHDA
jgi:hypothetical protein